MDVGSGEGMGRWGTAAACQGFERVVGAEDRRGARGGDEGGVGDGECSLHLLRAPAMLRVVLPVPDTSWLRAEDNQALDTVAAGKEVLGTRGVVRASALRACGSGRVVLAGDALGARGGDKAAPAMGNVARAAHAGGDEGGAGEYGRRRRRWLPGQRAALLVAAHVVWSIDTVEKASAASEDAPPCRTDGGAAKDRCGCELTPLDFWELRTGCTPDEEVRRRALRMRWYEKTRRGSRAGRQSQAVHAVRRGFSSTQNACGAAWGTGWEEAHEISAQEDYKR
ncbi:hypothetical protein B0H14DRAFT_3151375 [Mycena olivaceomarginata]|nr:hypothetical protein B0H14DRAFT_3151375 [Mycena olivaceomarginata]